MNPDYLDMLDAKMDPEKHGYSKFQVLGENGRYMSYDGKVKDELLKKFTFNEFLQFWLFAKNSKK